MSRAGIPNRNFPGLSLKDALVIARGIEDSASGKPMNRLLLADVLGSTPSSSTFKAQLSASRQYGLTVGTEKAERVELTSDGDDATSGDDARSRAALRRSALTPEPFGLFYREYAGRKVPAANVMRRWLEESAAVAANHSQLAVDLILANGKFVGLLRQIKGAEYVFLDDSPVVEARATDSDGSEVVESTTESGEALVALAPPPGESPVVRDARRAENRRVFITHGKNKSFIEPLKDLLLFGELEPVVAVERESVSVPVPDKVMTDMRSCGAAVIHVDAEQRLLDADGKVVIVLNPNVLIEIGAAAALYGRRFILLVKAGIQLPSNLSGLYEVRYDGDKLDGEATIRLLKAIKDIKNHPLPSAPTAT